MATPRKNPSNYPTEYSQLLRRAVHAPVEIKFDRHQRAAAFRKTLYAFRESLESVPEFDVELLFIARTMTVTVEGAECKVIVPKMPDLEDFK